MYFLVNKIFVFLVENFENVLPPESLNYKTVRKVRKDFH